MAENKPKGGSVVFGIVLSTAAWLLSSAAVAAAPLLNPNSPGRPMTLARFFNDAVQIGLNSGILWLMLIIAAAKIALDGGNKAAIKFVVASFFIFLVVVGGCYGMMVR